MSWGGGKKKKGKGKERKVGGWSRRGRGGRREWIVSFLMKNTVLCSSLSYITTFNI